MRNANRLMEEFEIAAQTVRSSSNANWRTPGVMVVSNSPLNQFRNSVATARLSYKERDDSKRFMDQVGKFQLRETSECNGTTVTQQWHYEKNEQIENYVFVRDFDQGKVREKVTLRRNIATQETVFDFSRA